MAPNVPVAPGKVPVLGHSISLLRDPIAFLQAQRELGDIVQIQLGTQPVYLVNSPDLIRRVLIDEAHKFDRGRFFDKGRPIVGNGLATADGQKHIRQRRLMQPMFHRDRLAGYAEIMNREIIRTVESWQPGQVISLDQELTDLVLRVTTKALFSTDLGAKAVADVQRWLPVMLNGMMLRIVLPDAWEKIPTQSNREFNNSRYHLRRVFDDVIESYRADGTDHQDLLSTLVAARYEDTGEPMSAEQVRDEVTTILVAGTETTATTLSWLFHELGNHPDVEKNVYAEIDTVLAGRQLTMADLPDLPYLDQVLNETLRRHHPIWLLMRKANTTLELGGATLTPGVEVLYSLATLHRDPALYPDPMAFEPNRWLTGQARNQPRASFLPFSIGSHKCIGDRFSWGEMAMTVAAVASRWRLVPVPGSAVRELPKATLRPSAIPMVVEPRNP
jgi:cytochrome P450